MDYKMQMIPVSVKLTDKEMADRGRRAAGIQNAINEVENNLKRIKMQDKAKIEDYQNQINAINFELSTGEKVEQHEAIRTKDNDRLLIYWIDPKTAEILRTEPFNSDDYQTTIEDLKYEIVKKEISGEKIEGMTQAERDGFVMNENGEWTVPEPQTTGENIAGEPLTELGQIDQAAGEMFEGAEAESIAEIEAVPPPKKKKRK